MEREKNDMKCIKCGKELNDNAKFCTGCGTRTGESRPAGEKASQDDKTEQVSSGWKPAEIANTNRNQDVLNKNNVKGKKPGRKKLVIFLAAVLTVLLICFAGIAAYIAGMFDFLLPLSPAQEIMEDAGSPVEESTDSQTKKTDVLETLETMMTTEALDETETTLPETTAFDAETTETMTAQEPETSAIPAEPQENLSQDEKIAYIREVYNRTYQNQGSYQAIDGKYYQDGLLVKAEVGSGNPVLDEVMKKNSYSAYSLQYYYDDQSSFDSYPIFIFAVIDDKEYRYYFYHGSFIRRIGPDGSVNDNPEANSFIEEILNEGKSYR